jgi:hypothetical protein
MGFPSSQELATRGTWAMLNHLIGDLDAMKNIHRIGSQSAGVMSGRSRKSRRKRTMTNTVVRSSATGGGKTCVPKSARIGEAFKGRKRSNVYVKTTASQGRRRIEDGRLMTRLRPAIAGLRRGKQTTERHRRGMSCLKNPSKLSSLDIDMCERASKRN